METPNKRHRKRINKIRETQQSRATLGEMSIDWEGGLADLLKMYRLVSKDNNVRMDGARERSTVGRRR